jgi:hypothetical protein
MVLLCGRWEAYKVKINPAYNRMSSYHLEVLEKEYCTDDLLTIFSRAHMTYINQIFGDATIREIITEVFPTMGKLIIEPTGADFEHSVHHVYYYNADEEPYNDWGNNENNNNNVQNGTPKPQSNNNVVKNVMNNLVTKVEAGHVGGSNLPSTPKANGAPSVPNSGATTVSANSAHTKVTNEAGNTDYNVAGFALNRRGRRNESETSKICSVTLGYQDLSVDTNDTLCQSYSLMAYLSIEFDMTPSADATVEQKFNKQLAMINMYRGILNDPAFIKELDIVVKNKDNKELWEDTVDDENPFFIIKKYKKTKTIVDNIKRVLDIWEKYGWQFFVGDGKCQKQKQDGGKRKTRRRRNSRRTLKK